MLPGEATAALARSSFLFEEFLAREADEGRLELPLKPLQRKAWLHGHCHQKAFGGVPAVDRMLARLPNVDVEAIESGCCGMAGAFGYHAEHYETSMAIGELDLLPQLRAARRESRIVADGTSCRAQIADGTGREAIHAAILLAEGLGD